MCQFQFSVSVLQYSINPISPVMSIVYRASRRYVYGKNTRSNHKLISVSYLNILLQACVLRHYPRIEPLTSLPNKRLPKPYHINRSLDAGFSHVANLRWEIFILSSINCSNTICFPILVRSRNSIFFEETTEKAISTAASHFFTTDASFSYK